MIIYVKHDFVRRTKSKWITSKSTSYSAFVDQKSQYSKERNAYDLNLLDIEGNNHSMISVEVMSICSPLPHQNLPNHAMQSLSQFQLEEDHGYDVTSLWTYWLVFIIIGNLFQPIMFRDLRI